MGSLRYYQTMARMAPGALVGAAARRVQGVARQALYKRREPLGEAALRRAFGGDNGPAWASRVLWGRGGDSWCGVSQRGGALEALGAVEGGAARVRERAEQALRGAFQIFETRLCFGEGAAIDWSLDPVSGYRYPLQPAASLVLSPSGVDPKYPWVMGRLDSLVALGQGYWLSHEEPTRRALAAAFVHQVEDFLTANPVGMGVHWSCSMEVALRAANLAQALCMFSDAPEVHRTEFLVRALSALGEHSAFVEAHLEDQGAVPNNHLVANFVGLLVVGALFPELPGALRQASFACQGLRDQIQVQVHEEGTSFEGSVPYHRLSVELFTLAWCVAKPAGFQLGPDYECRLRSMFHASQAWCSEKGLAPQVGDNDSGRVFPFRERPSMAHAYLSALGAVLFDDAALAGGGFEEEAVWLLGARGLARYQALAQVQQKPPSSVAFPSLGLYVLRSPGVCVSVSAGAQGQRGVGGHSHLDKLSFELHLDGEPLIVDSGTGGYTRHPSVRNAFRSTRAHNTLEVDGQEQGPLDEARLFALLDGTQARCEHFELSQAVDQLTVNHQGYRRLSQPVELSRTFALYRRAGVLAVTETLRGEGLHQVVGRLHLADGQARLRLHTEGEREALLQTALAQTDWAPHVVELGPVGDPKALLWMSSRLAATLEPSRYSPGYGEVRPAVRVCLQAQLQAPCAVQWALVFPKRF